MHKPHRTLAEKDTTGNGWLLRIQQGPMIHKNEPDRLFIGTCTNKRKPRQATPWAKWGISTKGRIKIPGGAFYKVGRLIPLAFLKANATRCCHVYVISYLMR